ncbi:hypothetical protein GQ55_7G292000 [Panicum hallii var. hallii]|uniref:Uncharacterized protein n=1 Tax=Panicum hallii var. hallii TaxID=1504633 RepID=A0A2T7D0C8_9POAL|nr:hypothetical protein GQ55_7G292000 [Panicum hallii var. hallii]
MACLTESALASSMGKKISWRYEVAAAAAVVEGKKGFWLMQLMCWISSEVVFMCTSIYGRKMTCTVHATFDGANFEVESRMFPRRQVLVRNKNNKLKCSSIG